MIFEYPRVSAQAVARATQKANLALADYLRRGYRIDHLSNDERSVWYNFFLGFLGEEAAACLRGLEGAVLDYSREADRADLLHGDLVYESKAVDNPGYNLIIKGRAHVGNADVYLAMLKLPSPDHRDWAFLGGMLNVYAMDLERIVTWGSYKKAPAYWAYRHELWPLPQLQELAAYLKRSLKS